MTETALSSGANAAPAPLLQEAPAPAAPPGDGAWSPARRVAFRGAFILAILYYHSFPLELLPFTDAPSEAYEKAFTRALSWVTTLLLHPPASELPEQTGSGDTLMYWVCLPLFVALAVVGAAVWTALDRRRTQYRTLAAWLQLWLRWALLFYLLVYGFSKVIPLQMPWIRARLIQPLGEMSPMGLLWTFLGASRPYEMLGGWGEVIAGLLLISRRTSTLGAAVALAVMGNVVALNFCYDVPVKLFSVQLWLTAACIAAPDARRLFDLLVLRRPTQPTPVAPLMPWPRFQRYRWAGPALAIALGGWTTYKMVKGALETKEKMAQMDGDFPLRGVWQVEAFTAPTTAEPGSLLTGPAWIRVGGWLQRITITRTDGSTISARVESDPDGTLTLSQRDRKEPDVVRLVRTDAEHVRLIAEGFEASLRDLPESSFELRSRGFNWVQALPRNR